MATSMRGLTQVRIYHTDVHDAVSLFAYLVYCGHSWSSSQGTGGETHQQGNG